MLMAQGHVLSIQINKVTPPTFDKLRCFPESPYKSFTQWQRSVQAWVAVERRQALPGQFIAKLNILLTERNSDYPKVEGPTRKGQIAINPRQLHTIMALFVNVVYTLQALVQWEELYVVATLAMDDTQQQFQASKCGDF